MDAMFYNSRVICNSPYDFSGINALERWQKDMENWNDLSDWKWVSRFLYQIIEKRGTGGGGFRFLYASFLKEVEEIIPSLKPENLYDKMYETAVAWQKLAMELKKSSEKESPDFSEVSKKLQTVYELESSYHRSVLSIS